MEVALAIAAGLGWGLAFGLTVALLVALSRKAQEPRPPANEQKSENNEYPFGRRAA